MHIYIHLSVMHQSGRAIHFFPGLGKVPGNEVGCGRAHKGRNKNPQSGRYEGREENLVL